MEKIDRFILDLVDIPDRDSKEKMPNFWRVLESEELKLAMVFCVLNELRNCGDISKLSNSECRSNLIKCQSYVSMLDLDSTILNRMSGGPETIDDLTPADVEFIEEEDTEE